MRQGRPVSVELRLVLGEPVGDLYSRPLPRAKLGDALDLGPQGGEVCVDIEISSIAVEELQDVICRYGEANLAVELLKKRGDYQLTLGIELLLVVVGSSFETTRPVRDVFHDRGFPSWSAAFRKACHAAFARSSSRRAACFRTSAGI